MEPLSGTGWWWPSLEICPSPQGARKGIVSRAQGLARAGSQPNPYLSVVEMNQRHLWVPRPYERSTG